MIRAWRKRKIRKACDELTRGSSTSKLKLYYQDAVWEIKSTEYDLGFFLKPVHYKVRFNGDLVFDFDDGRFNDGYWVAELVQLAKESKQVRTSKYKMARKAKTAPYDPADFTVEEIDENDSNLGSHILTAQDIYDLDAKLFDAHERIRRVFRGEDDM